MIKSIDSLPDRSQFDRPMFVLAISTPRNVKFLGNDCAVCLRVWEHRLKKRGWIDLGEKFGRGRIAPILRMWTTYGYGIIHMYDELMKYENGMGGVSELICVPEKIDQYDKDGGQFPGPCILDGINSDSVSKPPYPDKDDYHEGPDWWKKGKTDSDEADL